MSGWKWLRAVMALLAVILIPFALFGEQMESLSRARLSPESLTVWAQVFTIAALLASDVLLPVPSSIVSTFAGYWLGTSGGALTSWVGMTAGSCLGYALGRSVGERAGKRIVGDISWQSASNTFARVGYWAVALTRAVPVLAEATVIIAGSTRMRFSRFLIAAGVANLAISLAYAVAGARGANTGNFWISFGAALALPTVAWLTANAVGWR